MCPAGGASAAAAAGLQPLVYLFPRLLTASACTKAARDRDHSKQVCRPAPVVHLTGAAHAELALHASDTRAPTHRPWKTSAGAAAAAGAAAVATLPEPPVHLIPLLLTASAHTKTARVRDLQNKVWRQHPSVQRRAASAVLATHATAAQPAAHSSMPPAGRAAAAASQLLQPLSIRSHRCKTRLGSR